MASPSDCSGKDDVKTQFTTREGTYKHVSLADYSKPNRIPYNAIPSTPVRVSFVNIPDSDEKICFNVGWDLYVYPYKGIRKASDLARPIDKRMYKGTNPTCHDFNTTTMSPDSVSLLVGFSEGQIQLINPIKKEIGKLYNEDRQIDRTKVTCVKWIPGSRTDFLVSHSSGYMYVYNEELPCGTTPPPYQVVKQSDRLSVYSCKSKMSRNPVYRWVISDGTSGSVNEFAFSPCGKHLAVVSQDGFLRVFNYSSMELVGYARSYFGSLLCLTWSPDGRYVVTGGEDDLVTVFSLHEKRIVARGQGHRSWVSAVAFDPYTSCCDNCPPENRYSSPSGSLDGYADQQGKKHVPFYRFASIGQDTHLCLWDLTDNVLKPPVTTKNRTSVVFGATGAPLLSSPTSLANHVDSLPEKLSAVSLNAREEKGPTKKQEKKNFSFSRGSDKSSALKCSSNADGALSNSRVVEDPLQLVGTPACPRLDDCPLLEPLVCKKVSYERLTALSFKEDCFVVACQDGVISTWARPDRSMCSMEML